MSRRTAWVALLLAAGPVLSSCGGAEADVADRLRAAIRESTSGARSFTYVYRDSRGQLRVEGIVEDDARYQASLAIDGAPALDEVVSDDILANRFIDPTTIERFLRTATTKVTTGGSLTDQPSASPAASPSASPKPAAATLAKDTQLSGLPALRAGKWVVDRIGAPDLQVGAGSAARPLGADPVVDAVTVLRYVDAVLQVQSFREFNENDFDYRPEQDNFPAPEEDSGITRYDSVRTDLPSAQDIAGSSGRSVLPDIINFRKMSIYVDSAGRIIQVLEEIDVVGRLKDLVRRSGLDIPAGLSDEQVSNAVLGVINELRQARGEQPIIDHELGIHLTDFGDPLSVVLPTAGVVNASLAELANRGRSAAVLAGG